MLSPVDQDEEARLLQRHSLASVCHAEIETLMTQCERLHFDKDAVHVKLFEEAILTHKLPTIDTYINDGSFNLTQLLAHPLFAYFEMTVKKVRQLVACGTFENMDALTSTEVLEHGIADMHRCIEIAMSKRTQELNILLRIPATSSLVDDTDIYKTEVGPLKEFWDDPFVGSTAADKDDEYFWNIVNT